MSNLYHPTPYTKPNRHEPHDGSPHMSDKAQMRLEIQLLSKKIRSLNEEIELLKSVIKELDEEYFDES